MTTKPLIDYFETYLPLTEDEKSFLENSFKPRRIKKRQFILHEDDSCKFNTFVIEGCFRMYLIDQKGKEHNLQFAVENEWICDIGSFHYNEPSQLYIEAIENAAILQINKKDLINLFTNYPKFNRIFRVLTENALVSAQERILENISSTAEERYLRFQKKHPTLLNRISNVQIASYIGVTPEFLSKIRKEITPKRSNT